MCRRGFESDPTPSSSRLKDRAPQEQSATTTGKRPTDMGVACRPKSNCYEASMGG